MRPTVVLAVAVAAALATGAALPAVAATDSAFTLIGGVAGGITHVSTDQPLTFVFTEKNQSNRGADEDLVLKRATNVDVTGLTCITPAGHAQNNDGRWCEPGFVRPGRYASLIVTTTVTGAQGEVAAARVCLVNEDTGVWGACKTVKASIG